jgi:hypothetical protein
VTVVARPLWRLRLMGAMRRRLLRALAMAAVLTAVHVVAGIKTQKRQPAIHTRQTPITTAKESRR